MAKCINCIKCSGCLELKSSFKQISNINNPQLRERVLGRKIKIPSLFFCWRFALLVALAMADNTPKPIEDPKVNARIAGSPKDGFGVNVNVQKNIWQSDNGKHSLDATGGYSQHLGGPYGNSRPNFRYGGSYTYKW